MSLRPDPYAAAYAAADAVNLTDGETPIVPVNERLAALRVAITGQDSPPPAAGWRMSNYRSASRLDALEPLVQQLTSAVLSLTDTNSALQGQLQVQLAAYQTLQASQAADQQHLVAVEAKATLTASATEANRLDIVALKAEDVALKTRATQDEAAIATAQATATQARTEAAAAQKKADEDAAALLVLQGQLTQAQAAVAANTASLATVAADVATRLPAAAVQRFTISTPAVTLGTAVSTFNVVLPKAFTDNQYLVFFTPAPGAALLNVKFSDTAKLPASFTGTMQQTGLASLLVAASSAEVLAIHL